MLTDCEFRGHEMDMCIYYELVIFICFLLCKWNVHTNQHVYIPAFYRFLGFCIWPMKYFYGIKYTIQGSENLKAKEPYVIVANHKSCLDILGMMEILPERCVAIVKKELLYTVVVGWPCWLCNFIFIDRKKKHAAMSTIEHLAHTIREQNLKIWVFPEGTRNPAHTLLPFKRGAFHLAVQAQVPIVPVVTVSDGFYSFKDRKLTPGHCIIRILPKIETKGLNIEDTGALAEDTRRLMQDTLYEISGKTGGEKDASQ
uniref:1-acyl-sn-glycerol-3-phosphate acyltransferase n=1 Tax=Salvator merianae TaxID=96440 RepID=A0A8D0DGW6_SALMN